MEGIKKSLEKAKTVEQNIHTEEAAKPEITEKNEKPVHTNNQGMKITLNDLQNKIKPEPEKKNTNTNKPKRQHTSKLERNDSFIAGDNDDFICGSIN